MRVRALLSRHLRGGFGRLGRDLVVRRLYRLQQGQQREEGDIERKERLSPKAELRQA